MIVCCFFSACGFFYLRLCAVHLAMCVLCCDWCFCFSLCERIFLCCLRSFALARATSPCQSPRAGPQRFLVWVRVCWCCALEKQNAKYPLRGRLIISLNISKATACCAVSRKTSGGSPQEVFFYECRNHYRIYKTRSAPEILRCLRHRLRCQTAHHRR